MYDIFLTSLSEKYKKYVSFFTLLVNNRDFHDSYP